MEGILDKAVQCLFENGEMRKGDMVVLGCSTSEVAGGTIGKASVPELGERIAKAFMAACEKRGLQPAFQCCEHLNRALVMEKSALKSRGLLAVKAVPKPKAGGSVAAAAWLLMEAPALAGSVQAEAAIDIGDTMVGMHIRPVAVPVRIEEKKLGEANLVMAYSRLPLIGGERAQYI
jgi:TIGR01440 family protein